MWFEILKRKSSRRSAKKMGRRISRNRLSREDRMPLSMAIKLVNDTFNAALKNYEKTKDKSIIENWRSAMSTKFGGDKIKDEAKHWKIIREIVRLEMKWRRHIEKD